MTSFYTVSALSMAIETANYITEPLKYRKEPKILQVSLGSCSVNTIDWSYKVEIMVEVKFDKFEL